MIHAVALVIFLRNHSLHCQLVAVAVGIVFVVVLHSVDAETNNLPRIVQRLSEPAGYLSAKLSPR